MWTKKKLTEDALAVHVVHDNKRQVDETYIDFEMCRMYGCTPSELDEQDELRVEYHWHLFNEINRAKNIDAKKKKK
jgi:hypothetical protein